MNLPSIVAQRFLIACLLGCALGIYYEFLRPLRKKWTNLSDIAFVAGAFWVWLYLGFGVCEGDLRFGFSVALLGSSILFVVTIGSLLKPLFSIFWRMIGHILGVFAYPIKQFYKNIRFFSKFLFARVKKWGTMKKRRKERGERLGKEEKKVRSAFSAQFSASQMRATGDHRAVFGNDSAFARRDLGQEGRIRPKPRKRGRAGAGKSRVKKEHC